MSAEQLATRLSAKARVCIIIAGAAALLAGLLAVGQLGAGAATEEGFISAECTNPLGGPFPPIIEVEIPFTATNTPDAAEPGDEVSLTLATSYPEVVKSTTYYVNDVTTTYPLPPQVVAMAAEDPVEFGTSQGWSAEVLETVIDPTGEDSFVVIKFTGGPGTSPNPSALGLVRPTPSITFNVVLDDTIDDYYLTWQTATYQVTNAWTVLGALNSECTPVPPGQVLNSVTQVGNPTTTTTTTEATTTTTAPTTTTTAPDPVPLTPRFTG